MTGIQIRRSIRRIAPLLALAGLLPALGAAADDTALLAQRVPPNVVFVFDNSISMNQIVWHPSFRTDFIYDVVNCPTGYVVGHATCTARYLKYPLCSWNSNNEGGADTTTSLSGGEWFSNEGYRFTTGGNVTRCSNTRNLFHDPEVNADGNKTIWDERYLEWYFSDNVEENAPTGVGTIYSQIIATANGTNSSCLVSQGFPATFNRYRRSRITAAKNVTLDVICQTSSVADLRYGLAKFYPGTSDPDGGWVVVPVADYTTTQATALENAIDTFEGEALTPLAETLYNVYRYYQLRGTNEQPFGKDGSTRFPVYDLRISDGTVNSPVPVSPITSACQKHFVVMITDGEPTWDDFDDETTPDRMKPGKTIWRDNLIGDYYSPGDETEEIGGTREEAKYLDDVAYFMHQNDFLPTAGYPGNQTLDVYTVGFTTNATANDILSRAALHGGGEFYTSNDPDALVDAITGAINSIVAKARSFTSAAVPASRTTNGDNFYSAYFIPVPDAPFWKGHLKDFDFSAAGDVLTADGKCAVGVDPTVSPPCPTVGDLRTTAIAFWDAATALPAPTARKLYVEFGATDIFDQPVSFSVPATPAAAVPWFGLVTADNLVLPYSTLTAPKDTTQMATALINNLRGCVFDTSCTARVDAGGLPEYLGDIYHSSPVVVGSPAAPFNETSYREFATTYRDRTRVIYAGANDGFLHGFHAGDYQTVSGGVPLNPPRHDRGTGQELMGFMPYGVRNTVKNLLKHQSGGLRTAVYVDASPVAADVWFNREVLTGGVLGDVEPDMVSKEEEQWRTVLIQGLRDGGYSYSALDITDPPAAANVSTTTYPRYLWGFPCEDCGNAINPNTSGETTYMGRSWSEPVITRVRVKVDGGSDPRGYERWVAIFGGGYFEHGDPNGADYREPATAGFQPKGRAIYMVDISTGEVLASKHFDATATALSAATTEQVGIKEMRYAIASAPAVFDLDFDGFGDVIYIGDLGGNVWKWVISNPGQDPIHNSTYDDPAQPDWPFRLFFRAGTSLEPTLPPEQRATPVAFDTTVHYQSFFYPPTALMKGSTLLLAFGAGERNDPIGPGAMWDDGCGSVTGACANNNHYYVVKDTDPLEGVGTLPNRLTGALAEANLADFDSATPLTCAQMNATTSGYFITARDSEKFLSNSFVFLGTLYTGSFLPNDPDASSTCEGAGSAYLYAFDVECGVGRFSSDPGSFKDKRRKAIGTGIPTRPRISVGDLNSGGGGGSCKNRVVMVTSDGRIVTDCGDEFDGSGVGIRSWRER